jgi:uncharacterized RDD family membrane protein YckC
MFCSKCGAATAEGAAFCSSCGAPLGGLPSEPVVPAAAAGTPVAPQAMAVPAYAGFWLRAFALVIDSILLFIPLTFVIGFMAISMGVAATLQEVQPGESLEELTAQLGVRFLLAMMLTLLVGAGLYFSIFESSSMQATPGKRLLGLYVTDLNGNRPSFARASGRFFAGKFFVLGVPGLGFLFYCLSCFCAGLTARKQALYDMISGCLVLRKV